MTSGEIAYRLAKTVALVAFIALCYATFMEKSGMMNQQYYLHKSGPMGMVLIPMASLASCNEEAQKIKMGGIFDAECHKGVKP